MKPLAGHLVVDLTRYLPGAFASRELQRLGARVVRLEPPEGDPMRHVAPAWDEALNAGKESVACDLKTEPELARALLARADVVLEGFRPGVAARLGVGPDDVPPSAVYCSITGFGTEGPHAGRAGHDLNYLGWAGVLEDTAPGLPPLQPADLAAGALGAVAEILAALLERERTGHGARLTISMTHGSHRLVSHRLGGDPLPRFLTGGLACYRIYGTADGRQLTVGALEPKFFVRLCELIGRPELAEQPVRRRRPGRARSGARRRVRAAAARGVARALRRRGRVRRAGRDARGVRGRVRRRNRHAVRPRRAAYGGMAGRARLLLTAVALAPLPLLAVVAWNTEAEAARGLAHAVVSVRDGDLYVGDRQVTSGGGDSDPDWSPDRRRIAFVRQDPGKRSSSLYVIRRDGGALQRLTRVPQVVSMPAWRGDGRMLAYSASPLAGGSFDVWTVAPDGGTPRRVLEGPAEQIAPAFTRSGKVTAKALTPGEPFPVKTSDSGTPQVGPRELLPDLDQRAPFRLTVAGTKLGFASATDNVGDGPVWVRGSRAERDRPDARDPARPHVRPLGTGVSRRRPTSLHAVADAHALAPARLPALRAAHARRRARRARPQERLLPRRPLRSRCPPRHGVHRRQLLRQLRRVEPARALAVEQGTSIGFTDLYPAHFHGQNLELRGVPAGVYVLVHRANPEQRLEEIDYTNNDASLRIRLSWSGGTPHVETLRTCQGSADC